MDENIAKRDKKYLSFINILVIINIFLVVVIGLIYLEKKKPTTNTKSPLLIGQMPPQFRIRPVSDSVDAKKRTMEYVNALGLKGLVIKRVISFKNYYYIYLMEPSTERVAFALNLIKLGEFTFKKFPYIYSQMRWNKKYGHESDPNEKNIPEMTITMQNALEIATDVTKKLGESYRLTKNPDIYYGLYEFIVFQNHDPVGEITINGYSGKVYYKTYSTPPIEFDE